MRKLVPGFFILLLVLVPLFSGAEESVPAEETQSVIARFLDEPIDPEAIARPLDPESDLKMLHLTAAEAFLDQRPGADTMLFIVFKVESKQLNSLPVFTEQEHEDQIEYNGKSIRLDQFRGSRNIISCELVTGHSWAWYDYSDDGLFIISCIMNPDVTSLEDSSKVSFRYYCENLQTGEKDSGTVTVTLPPMIAR